MDSFAHPSAEHLLNLPLDALTSIPKTATIYNKIIP